jgi:GntR family transcriptional regulator, rspAB operon transcriptional repressor
MPIDLTSVRLDRKRPLREQAYALIRQLILSNIIAPGEVVDEKRIAAHLNISRTPVREALKKLSDEHLIDIVAQSGTRAAQIDRHEVEQAFLIRRALETEAAAQAATRMTDDHADRLNQILKSQTRALEERKFTEAIAHDDAFHRYIADISNLPRLWGAVEICKGQLDRCRHMMLPRPGAGQQTLTHHRRIILALLTGDPEKARTEMARHLEVSFYNAAHVLDANVRRKSVATPKILPDRPGV